MIIIGTLCFLCNRNCERAEKDRWKRYGKAREIRSENEESNETSIKRNTTKETQPLHETLQNLDHKVSRVSSAFDTESRVLAFKEAMELSLKDYKIIFCIFIINVALGSVVRMLGEADREFDILTLICIFIAFIFLCFFIASPIILILHIRLTKKLKKQLQQLEDTFEQRDKALTVQKRRKK